MSSDSSYPIIIPQEVLVDVHEVFKKKGWKWYGNLTPTPIMIETSIKEKTMILLQEDTEEPDWVRGGRICLVPQEYVEGIPKRVLICVEFGEFDVTYDSSPTKRG